MEKKKKWVIWSAIGLLVIGIAVIVFIFWGKSQKEASIQTQIDDLLIITRDMNYVVEEEKTSADVGTEILTLILEHVTYDVKKMKSNNCEIEVMAPDIYSLYTKLMEQSPVTIPNNYEEYENLVNQRLQQVYSELKQGNYEMRSKVVEVPVKDGKIETTNEFADAIYGGLVTLQEEIIEKYIGGNENE